MDIQEAIEWTDDRVFAKTGKRLDSLQRTILEGTLENQSYKQIAEDYHCTKDHTKRVAADLWKLLSDVLGEEVKKANFKSTLKRIEYSSNILYFGSDDRVKIGDINFCSDLYHQSKKNDRPPRNKSQPHHDLSQAPEYDRLYNRTDQLATLKQWILEENSRIITITGLSGIGKTALTRQLLEQIKDNFDRILWRSHRKLPNLNVLQSNIIEFIAPTPSSQNPSIINDLNSRNSLLDHLRDRRCLIILDDFQETLTPGELVGNYRSEYQNYGQLINEIGQHSHHSCLLLLSWEQPLEIAALETETRYCKTLQVSGLDRVATQLLSARKLKDPKKWSELIQLYNGNPLWLNIIASTILDLFNGSVQEFLSYPTLFLGDLEPILKQHYQRLCESEKILLQWLANQDQPVKISQKPPELLSDRDFLKAVQSLKRRSLLEKSLALTLQPTIAQYVKNQQDRIDN